MNFVLGLSDFEQSPQSSHRPLDATIAVCGHSAKQPSQSARRTVEATFAAELPAIPEADGHSAEQPSQSARCPVETIASAELPTIAEAGGHSAKQPSQSARCPMEATVSAVLPTLPVARWSFRWTAITICPPVC